MSGQKGYKSNKHLSQVKGLNMCVIREYLHKYSVLFKSGINTTIQVAFQLVRLIKTEDVHVN